MTGFVLQGHTCVYGVMEDFQSVKRPAKAICHEMETRGGLIDPERLKQQGNRGA